MRVSHSPWWCHLQWRRGPCTMSSSCLVWVARQVPLLLVGRRYCRGLLSRYLACLTLGSLLIQWRKINAFRGFNFIFLVSVLGWDESWSSLARQKRSKESPDTVKHSKCRHAGQRSQPTLLYVPRLRATAGNSLWGAPERLHKVGLDADFGYLPVSLSELSWKAGHFFLLKLGKGVWKQCLGYPVPLA